MSPHETKAVNLIAKQGLKASVMGWARAVKEDIESVIKTDADAVAISIATSDIHLKHKLKMDREQVVSVLSAWWSMPKPTASMSPSTQRMRL